MRDAGSSRQSIKTTQSTSQTAAHNRSIHRKLYFCSFAKNKGPNTGHKKPADKRPTKKRAFHVIGIIKTRLIKKSGCLHFIPILINSCIFLVGNIVVFWYFAQNLEQFYRRFCSLDIATSCSIPPVLFLSRIQCPCATICS